MTYAKEWYYKNRKKHLQNCKKYYLEDKEKYKKQTIKWQKENPEATKEIRQKSYLKNKEKANKRSRTYTLKRRIQVLEVYGGKNPKCKHCGCNEIKLLHLDHIKNDGKQEREKLGLLGAGFYGWLIKNNYPNKKKYQILCKNCNWIKHVNNLKTKEYGSKYTKRKKN